MNADVFVSYSSKDKNVANAMVHFLEEQKIRCWIAPRDIPGGSDYPDAIARALKNVAAVVFICSENSLKSIWCKKEVERALNYNKNIFPFKIEETELTSGWDILISLEHWIDAIPDPEEKFGKIAADLRKFLDRPAESKRIDKRSSKNDKNTVQASNEEVQCFGNRVALPTLGKALDEVTLTGLTGKDAEHFKKALGYYRVLRRRSALKELQAIDKKDDPIVRYYVARFSYELDGAVLDADFEEACRAARELGCTDAMVAFAEKHLLDDDSSFDPVSRTECIDWLCKSITKGSADALLALGGAYENGKGVDKDIVLARELLKMSASENSMRGMLAYGFDLIGGGTGTKDLSTAKKILRPVVDHLMKYEDELTSYEFAYLALYHLFSLSERGDDGKGKKYCKLTVESKGCMICDGLTVREHIYWFLGNMALQEDDANGAIEYYKQASQIGVNGLGELGLASCYENGYGVPEDEKKARDYYQIASDKGNGEAQRSLAFLYLGEEDNQNEERGKTLLKMAADGGDAIAEHVYGMFLISGRHFDKNVSDGMKWLEKAAVQDCDADAMNSLGEQYRDGNEVVEINSEKAFDWFRRGAEAGSSEAMESLGLAYVNGTGVVEDVEEGRKWLVRASEQGSSSAECYLGMLYASGTHLKKDMAEAIKWWERAAEHGDESAMSNLGTIYRDGDGVEKNLEKAKEWFVRAVKAGSEDAACVLGAGYYRGDFGTPDMKEALEWSQKAARLGDATAMDNLGIMYRDGTVGNADAHEAIKWFKRSAKCNNPDAMINLAAAYLKGDGVEKDVAKAEDWFCKAAATGDADAECTLGTRYAAGDFGSEDYSKAKLWWEKASGHGDSTAMYNLAASYRDGDFGDKDSGQWIYWLKRSIEMGNTDAMEEYAIYLFENGDEAQSKELLTRASDAGNASAMNRLALRLYNGDFGVKDVKGAVQLWERAAELKFGKAMCNLGELYLAGDDDISPDADIALSWYKRAADEGEGFGCCRMGQHYLSIMAKRIDSYDEFAKCVSASFGDESSKIRAIRKAKGMFAKAIESNDPGAVAYGHLTLARIAKLQGDEETSNEHYATAAEYGLEEHAPQSIFARMLDSVPFLKRKRT